MSETPRTDWRSSSASRMTATFTDYDDPYTPYDGRAVQISVTADVLFIYVGKLTEERERVTFACESADDAVGVDAQAFYEALGTILRREDRSNAERAREGTLPADSPMRTTAPVMAHLPATRNRA